MEPGVLPGLGQGATKLFLSDMWPGECVKAAAQEMLKVREAPGTALCLLLLPGVCEPNEV